MLHNCTVHGADLTYISLLVILCMWWIKKSWNMRTRQCVTSLPCGQLVLTSWPPSSLCKKHLMDALERILSDVSWDHWVFRVSQHHTPSPRWPSQGWSSPDLRPSSSPRISPLNPKPPSGLLCGFARGLNGPPLGHPCNTQTTEDFAKWTSCKASTANFYRLIEGPPASLPALLHQFLVLGTFPLIGFLNTLFPGHSEFQHDQLF